MQTFYLQSTMCKPNCQGAFKEKTPGERHEKENVRMFLYKCRRILDKREKKQHNSTSFGQHNVL